MLTQKNWLLPLVLGLISTTLFITSCDDEEEDADIVYNLSGNANGAQETPSRTNTPATGTLSGTYNKNTNIMQYTINWTGLTANPTGMHFHGPDDPGVSHPNNIQVHITGFTPALSGTVTETDTLTEVQEGDMLMGKYYYNIHTPTYPAGEIRGQVFALR